MLAVFQVLTNSYLEIEREVDFPPSAMYTVHDLCLRFSSPLAQGHVPLCFTLDFKTDFRRSPSVSLYEENDVNDILVRSPGLAVSST